MKESLSVRFLYHTAFGRALLSLLVSPAISRAVGRYLDSGLSRCWIKSFQRKNAITLDGIAVPAGGFASFNDFFSRSREKVSFDEAPNALCSPCDAFLSCYRIDKASSFEIKNSRYSLSDLLQDAELAESFQGGTALIFRLTPAHYHRYHYIDNGTILAQKRIDGVLHCVRPIATELYPVYVQNSREYTLIRSEHFGDMVQMEVGALFVGKIKNHTDSGEVRRGEEKGSFAFGGSTIVLLLQKDAVDPASFPDCLDNGREVPVMLGKTIAFYRNFTDKCLL